MASRNIFELWQSNGKFLPFAARRSSWAADSYVVVREVQVKKWPYGTAKGVYHIGGTVTTGELEEINCAGCYQWSVVDGLGFERGEYQGPERTARIYTADDQFDFGKYKKRPSTVGAAIQKDAPYIRWCIKNVDSFCIDPETLEALNPEDPTVRLGRKIRELNRAKADKAANTEYKETTQ